LQSSNQLTNQAMVIKPQQALSIEIKY